jgi:hypothetical protein
MLKLVWFHPIKTSSLSAVNQTVLVNYTKHHQAKAHLVTHHLAGFGFMGNPQKD